MRVLVIGASTNANRFSNKAVKLLRKYGHTVFALGAKNGVIADVEIMTGFPKLNDIHTITLYLNPQRQKNLYDYILSLNPKRIIFNPGTENIELENLAKARGIEIVENCTLVMLRSGIF